VKFESCNIIDKIRTNLHLYTVNVEITLQDIAGGASFPILLEALHMCNKVGGWRVAMKVIKSLLPRIMITDA
jgi:hypothetical protein